MRREQINKCYGIIFSQKYFLEKVHFSSDGKLQELNGLISFLCKVNITRYMLRVDLNVNLKFGVNVV